MLVAQNQRVAWVFRVHVGEHISPTEYSESDLGDASVNWCSVLSGPDDKGVVLADSR